MTDKKDKEIIHKPTKIDRLLLKHNVTESELENIIKSSQSKMGQTHRMNISNRHVKYGYFSDPHIGHDKFQLPLWDKMCRHFKREKIDFIVDAGDNLEGMSNRPGHIFELTHVGFSAQIEYAADLFNELPAETFGIDGNHDQWYFKPQNMGVVVGDELAIRVDNYKNLGQDEARIKIAPSLDLLLFHANDGSAYATSYKLQKLIESFDGGDKPSIVHSGHYHKALYAFIRNVHGFESGTLCAQSKYMRGKKLPAHMGYGIVDVYYNNKGVDRLKHEFVPHYI